MRKFRIIPIAHSLKGNKIAKSGDIVEESQLSSPANELVLAGYLEDVTESEKAKADAETETETETENIEVVSETVKKEVKPKK